MCLIFVEIYINQPMCLNCQRNFRVTLWRTPNESSIWYLEAVRQEGGGRRVTRSVHRARSGQVFHPGSCSRELCLPLFARQSSLSVFTQIDPCSPHCSPGASLLQHLNGWFLQLYSFDGELNISAAMELTKYRSCFKPSLNNPYTANSRIKNSKKIHSQFIGKKNVDNLKCLKVCGAGLSEVYLRYLRQTTSLRVGKNILKSQH